MNRISFILKIFLFTEVSQLSVFAVIAQQTVTGKATVDTNSPLPGVSLQLRSTLTGTFSNMDGNFTIITSPETTKKGRDGKPVVSFDGYYGMQLTVNIMPLANKDQYITMLNAGEIATGYVPRDPAAYPSSHEVFPIPASSDEKMFNKISIL